MKSNLTTLCYIERGDEYLMLHRIKKENDVNHDKWIGVGGHFEAGESPEECLLREVYEETGLTLTKWRFCGIVTFCFTPEPSYDGTASETGTVSDADTASEDRMVSVADMASKDGTVLGENAVKTAPPICEYMHLYTASSYEGTLTACDEGELVWVKKDAVERLPIWEGDRIFLRLLRERSQFFSLKLSYIGDRLTEAVLDGELVTLPLKELPAQK